MTSILPWYLVTFSLMKRSAIDFAHRSGIEEPISLFAERSRIPRDRGSLINWHRPVYDTRHVRVNKVNKSREPGSGDTRSITIDRRGRFSKGTYKNTRIPSAQQTAVCTVTSVKHVYVWDCLMPAI